MKCNGQGTLMKQKLKLRQTMTDYFNCKCSQISIFYRILINTVPVQDSGTQLFLNRKSTASEQ